MNETKTCNRCGIAKPLTAFTWQKKPSTPSGGSYSGLCKRCRAAHSRSKWPDRKDAINSIIYSAKDVPCADCGVRYPPYVMDFDHPPGTKEFAIAHRNHTVSLDRLRAEIAKCDVVCSNCHRERTFQRRHRQGAPLGERPGVTYGEV